MYFTLGNLQNVFIVPSPSFLNLSLQIVSEILCQCESVHFMQHLNSLRRDMDEVYIGNDIG